jgi:RNA polymerase sigma-70 factor (ECF subfamily)
MTTEDIWNEYHAKLSAFLKARVAEDMVDDILQDVFIKIHNRIDSLKESTRLRSWIYQITRNTVIDYYRSKKPTVDLPAWLEQTQPDQKETIRHEISICLEPMVGQLPDKYRAAVQLSEIEGKTQKEVAELEHISLSGAKSRVQRGRGMLKTMLHECCELKTNDRNQLIDYKNKDKSCKLC